MSKVRVFFRTPQFSVVTGRYIGLLKERKLGVVEIDGAAEHVARNGFWLRDDTVLNGIEAPDGYIPPGAIIRVEEVED